MIPDIAKSGHSFKGAFAYYLHDKRQEGDQQHPTTADRVAWTETRNLATDNPQTAKRIMIATASQADQLKAAAGVATTGRKSTAHVYAYSLAWHPDEAEGLDRAEMTRAADSSLKALGADHLQAVFVCHMERAHPHVHVIVNRVDPETGKMLTTSNDRLKLSDWANAYERERGRIVTPKREEKRQLREQFDQAQRQSYAQDKKAQAEQTPPRSKAAQLAQDGKAQTIRHRAEWDTLTATAKAERDGVYNASRERITAALALHRAESKPIWAQFFREQRAEQRAFAQREQTLSGVISNAINTTVHQKVSGQLGNRGVLSATFSNMLSSQARAAAFSERETMNRQQMATRLKNIVDADITAIKADRAAELATKRQDFEAARLNLIERQTIEREKIRQQWRELSRDRQRKEQGQTATPALKKPPVQRTRYDIKKLDQMRERRRAEYEAQRLDASKKDAAAMVKKDWERANTPGTVKAAPTVREFVARPAPAPSPSGDMPRVPEKRVQTVPVQEKPAPAERAALAQPRKDWAKAATPANTSEPPAPKKDWAKTAQRPADIKPLPERDKNRDRDR